MSEAVIIEAVRTPIGRRKGALSNTRPDEMAAHVLQEIVHRTKLDPSLIEDVILGCVDQIGEQTWNIARNSLLVAGFPIEVNGVTIDRQCGSSQQAIHFAASGVIAGTYDVVIAGGVEHMTRIPLGSGAEIYGNPIGPKWQERFKFVNQGISAEMIAEQWKLSREELDELSLASHQKATAARDSGRFQREIAPIQVTNEENSQLLFDSDQGIRPDTSIEKLGSLKPAFKEDGCITAGNSSQISDGASALLIMSKEKAQELGLKPRARIIAQALAGVNPTIMLTGPIPATQKALQRAGLKMSDIDLFEVNEAFASVVLAWQRELQPDMEKVNVNGGAIALGHPLGASGARIMATLLHEMERRDVRYGLQTMCEGGGLGIATIIDRNV